VIRRLTPYLLIAALCAVAAIAIVSVAEPAVRPLPDPPPGAHAITDGWLTNEAGFYTSSRCEGARRGLRYYRDAYSWNRSRMRLAGAPPLVRYPCEATRRRAAEWRERAQAARAEARRWLYDWRSWLPRNWYLVGSCETGYGGPPNWSHGNSSYVSAFGISVREYNADARHMGARPWSYSSPPPPRHQYLAALGHYARFGDGWGCSGP
jgi:hypothetical protein